MVAQPRWIDRPTPNRSKRRLRPTLIVLHHTGATQAAGSVAWLTDPRSRVSADFVVARDGSIYKLNPQLSECYTWHAGASAWNGRRNCNEFSFGIEQAHAPGDDWPDVQVFATAQLCAWLIERYESLRLDDHCIQSHAAVATPKGRKTDPESFPWLQFGAHVRNFLKAG